MLEPKTESIDGVEFQFLPMDPITVKLLEKRIIPLLLPVIGAIKSFDLTADMDLAEAMDMESLVQNMTTALVGLSDTDFRNFLETMLRSMTVVVPGAGAVSAGSTAGQTVFQGNSMLMYKVLVAAMRFNKFLPFGAIEDGSGILGIVSSTLQNGGRKSSGLKLDRSVKPTKA